ncbi:PDZ domain-containing protein [Candidatus Woesearchaeota archaeon]|jgi:hypothetical protein|nr:PDZ domain-containing protein [Candidatus Woesearchaeota archaeon]MBT6518340.1 PDZ domain-containing protein [Candidatus Woesearchaeota archaeon]MBT7366637.1 PDZ domain-containing protein [Candidatus Woesearchaeota archaeon]
MAIEYFSPILMDYKSWAVATIILNVIFVILLLLIYKKTSKDYHSFSKGKTIATVICYILVLVSQISQLFLIDFNRINFGSDLLFGIMFIFAFILGLVVSFFMIYLFISSIVLIFRTIKKKLYKKNKKEFVVSWLVLIFGNSYSTAIIFLIIFAIISSVLHPMTYEPCGLLIEQVSEDSPAADIGINTGEIIIKVNNQDMLVSEDLVNIISDKSPGDNLLIKTDKSEYNLIIGSNPNDESIIYLGINVFQKYCDK